MPTSPQTDPLSRTNGPTTKPAAEAVVRSGSGRSRVAGRVDRLLNGAVSGQPAIALNATAGELLAESVPVARVISATLDRPGVGLTGHWRVRRAFQEAGVCDELVNSLAADNALTRSAAARLCGALRLSEAVCWIGDMLDDGNPGVRDAAARSLAQLGGRRAVETLMARIDRIPPYRLAISLSRAASDVDIEALMRQPADERSAVVTVLACGLRRDALRVPPLLGIAHDRRWPRQVRMAACKALAMISVRAAADGLGHLERNEPDPAVRAVAERAHRRLLKRAVGRPR